MKRWQKLVIGCLFIFSFGLLLLLKRPPTAPSASAPSPNILSPPLADSGKSSPSLQPTTPGVSGQTGIVQNTPKEQLVKEHFSHPISFFGVVRDEGGNPVAGAHVEYSIYSNWLSPNQKSTAGPESDNSGRFSITGQRGASIFVRVTHQEYYETETSKVRYSFAMPIAPPPTVANPTVFVLRKKGNAEPLLKLMQVKRGVPKDGKPVQIGLRGEQPNDLVLEVWTLPPENPSQVNAPFTWNLRLTVPGGGLLAYQDGSQFQAPADGYVQTIEFSMPANGIEGKWRNDFEQLYFIKLNNGHYARMRFQMMAGHNHFAVIESYYNPSGSQNLEYDPTKAIDSDQN